MPTAELAPPVPASSGPAPLTHPQMLHLVADGTYTYTEALTLNLDEECLLHVNIVDDDAFDVFVSRPDPTPAVLDRMVSVTLTMHRDVLAERWQRERNYVTLLTYRPELTREHLSEIAHLVSQDARIAGRSGKRPDVAATVRALATHPSFDDRIAAILVGDVRSVAPSIRDGLAAAGHPAGILAGLVFGLAAAGLGDLPAVLAAVRRECPAGTPVPDFVHAVNVVASGCPELLVPDAFTVAAQAVAVTLPASG